MEEDFVDVAELQDIIDEIIDVLCSRFFLTGFSICDIDAFQHGVVFQHIVPEAWYSEIPEVYFHRLESTSCVWDEVW